MGRKRTFERDEILKGALKLFWEKGYAETSLHELEAVTGVNKSGLYSEFDGKFDLFLSALRHYLGRRGARAILGKEPLGLANIRKFLEIGETYIEGCRGCFSINSMREVRILPSEAIEIIEDSQAHLKRLVMANIRAARPDADSKGLADITMTFFSGLCVEQNLPRDPHETRRKVLRFMKVLESA